MKRLGQIIGIKPEKLEEYKVLHKNPWPEILAAVSASNLRNYSVYYKDDLLFAYFEYTGEDFDADMAKLGAHPKIQEWWAITDPCQTPLATRSPGEWWATMEEVFHTD